MPDILSTARLDIRVLAVSHQGAQFWRSVDSTYRAVGTHREDFQVAREVSRSH